MQNGIQMLTQKKLERYIQVKHVVLWRMCFSLFKNNQKTLENILFKKRGERKSIIIIIHKVGKNTLLPVKLISKTFFKKNSGRKEGREKDGRLATPLQDLNIVGYTEEPAYF